MTNSDSFFRGACLRKKAFSIALLLVQFCILSTVSCSPDVKPLERKAQILQISIAAIIANEARRGTDSFFVDFSGFIGLDRGSALECIRAQKNLIEVNADSLYAVDSLWRNEKRLMHPIVRIDSIVRDNDLVRIQMSKTHSPLAVEGYEVTLKWVGDAYVFVEKKIVWRS